MIDLNDLRVFERVAALSSFSVAARALDLPKSSVSRSISRLERSLGTRLFQRTTREVILTAAGQALRHRSAELMERIDDTMTFMQSLSGTPGGVLRISAGIGFGINVLSRHLPDFLRRYPEVDVRLDLTSRDLDLVADRVDVAIRMGPLESSSTVATRLGSIPRCLVGAPDYLRAHGVPRSPTDLTSHRCIEMPRTDGRIRTWSFFRGKESATVEVHHRVTVNDALTLHRLVRNGAGLGVVSAYLVLDDLASGAVTRLLTDWSIPAIEVNLLYPSRRQLSASVRVFVDFMREVSVAGEHWQSPLAP